MHAVNNEVQQKIADYTRCYEPSTSAVVRLKADDDVQRATTISLLLHVHTYNMGGFSHNY